MKRVVIAILAAALILLAATFGLNGIAAKRAQEEHLWLMRTLLADEAATFQVEPYAGEDETIRSVHKSEFGYVIETVTRGYADEMTVVVGVSNDGRVTGLVVLDAHETLGLGSKALTDHVFLSQFLNKSGTFTIGNADAFSGATGEAADAGEEVWVDGITGATVTSKAVARCVTSAVAYVTGTDAASAATSWGG